MEIDYVSLWNEQHARSVVQKEKMGEGGGTFWSNQDVVDRFVRNVVFGESSRIEKQIAEMEIPPGSSILDIGTGPGTLAVPLAVAGCHVTTVEPSEPMSAAMETCRKMAGAPPIREIRKCWENVTLDEVGVHDVVIASRSLIMGDIGNCLLRMDAAARRVVHLYWFLVPPSSSGGNEELWPVLHGEPYCSEANADVLWNALCQLGIYANLTIETKGKSQWYADFAELTRDYYHRLSAHEEWQQCIVDAFLADRVVHERSRYAVPGLIRTAHIWWEKEIV
ncbi:MAG: class I SAM-dependent methyltransferase [Methanocalculaceae archaeon]|jgi:SAM-dependent methyltransferase|nr:class I SAM-dependent methyltransferase [Methanocalculaceae archaeon]